MERTLTIVKPDAVKLNATGDILRRIEQSGLKILAVKMLQLDRSAAGRFYAVHKDKPFFHSLVEFMTSGPVVVAALEGSNAVVRLRTLIGSTDPAKADEGTIRRLYGTRIEQNAVHGSDSPENGLIETSFFFSELELHMTD